MTAVDDLREAADHVRDARGDLEPMIDAKLADYEDDLRSLADLVEEDAEAAIEVVGTSEAAEQLHVVGTRGGD